MTIMYLGFLFLAFRIAMLGAERIFLKYLQHYSSIPVASLFFLVAAVLLTPVFSFVPLSAIALTPVEWTLVLISSLFYSIGFYAYVKAISLGDASLIAPLYNSSLLWLLFLGFLFLGDAVTTLRIIGAVILFIGVFFLYPGSLREKLVAIRTSNASWYMIGGSFFVAVGRTIDAFTTSEIASNIVVNQSYYAFLINLSVGVYLLIFSLVRGQYSQLRRILREKPMTITLAGLTNGWAYLCLLLAIGYLQVTVAEPASLLSVFVTALLAKIFLHENVEQRLPGMVLMVIGAILLSLSVQ